MRSLVTIVVLVAIVAPIVRVAPAEALEVVYVMRHLQKDRASKWDQRDDLRPLSKKGAHCSEQLAEHLDTQGLAAIYTTEVVRTLSTGSAVSRRLDYVVLSGDDRTQRPSASLVQELKDRHDGDRAILIVGHSDTVDDLVLAFRPDASGCLDALRLKVPKIPTSQYGDIWRLDIGSSLHNCTGATVDSLGASGGDNCKTK